MNDVDGQIYLGLQMVEAVELFLVYFIVDTVEICYCNTSSSPLLDVSPSGFANFDVAALAILD
jgi:hypothetical protein